MNEMTYLCKTHLFGMSSFFKSSWPQLKGEFISCGLILSCLGHEYSSVDANLCPPLLHIKWLILSFGEHALKQSKTFTQMSFDSS